MTRPWKRSLTEPSRTSRMQSDLSKKAHSSGIGFGQPWLMTFKWAILPPNGSFRQTTIVSQYDGMSNELAERLRAAAGCGNGEVGEPKSVSVRSGARAHSGRWVGQQCQWADQSSELHRQQLRRRSHTSGDAGHHLQERGSVPVKWSHRALAALLRVIPCFHRG